MMEVAQCFFSRIREKVFRWRVVKSGWRAAENSSPPSTALFIGVSRGKVKSEEYFRVCFHIIFIGQDYDMTTHLPDFCEPSLRMIWSSCIFLRCLRMALLLMFRVLAISREVIFPLLAISCKMAFLVSGPPLFSFLSSSSFCKDTMNILISQEKMGDNIKKWRIFLLSLIFAVSLQKQSCTRQFESKLSLRSFAFTLHSDRFALGWWCLFFVG